MVTFSTLTFQNQIKINKLIKIILTLNKNNKLKYTWTITVLHQLITYTAQ